MRSKRSAFGEDAVEAALGESGIAYRVLSQPKGGRPRARPDIEVRFPEAGVSLLLDCHRAVAPHQLDFVSAQLSSETPLGSHTGIVVPRLSEALLAACKERHLAAIDLAGNAWIRLPNLYIERWRPAKATREAVSGTVFTAKASRLVRAFLSHFPNHWVQVELAAATDLSQGYVSKLVGRMKRQGYVTRHLDLLRLDEPDRLLDDWLAHYRFDRHARRQYAVSMNSYDEGLHKVAMALRRAAIRYAFTGWSGAHLRAPYATPTTVMAYVDELPGPLPSLFPVEGEGNVILLAPHDEGVFQFATHTPQGDVASDPQLYLDLCRMPGRAHEQADALRHARLDFAEMAS